MTYTLEKTNDYTKKFHFHFDGLDPSETVERALVEKQKTAHLKGFRKGKVPLSMIRNLYGAGATQKAVHSMVLDKLREAVEKEGLRPLGDPLLKDLQYENGLITAFEAEVQYLPDFKVKDFSHLSFTKELNPVREEDLQEELHRELGPHAQMKSVEDKEAVLGQGQFAVIDYQGIDEAQNPVEDLKGEEYLLEIGPHTFGIPQGGRPLEGMKVGETREIDLSPQMKLKVNLLEIKIKTYPPLTDALAKELGHSSKEEMEVKAQKKLEYRNEKISQDELKQKIIDGLMEENDPVLPPILIQNNVELLRRDTMEHLRKSGKREDEIEDHLEKHREEIAQRAHSLLKQSLILTSLAKEYSIVVTDDDAKEEYENTLAVLGLSPDQARPFSEITPESVENFRNKVWEEKILKKIQENVQITTAPKG